MTEQQNPDDSRFVSGADSVDFEPETEDDSEKEKNRVYVSSPSEAPEDADVQEGNRGGYYYQTGSDTDTGSEGDSETDTGSDGDSGTVEAGNLDESVVGEQVSFSTGTETVEGELVRISEDYKGRTRLRVQLEDQPDDFPPKPYRVDPDTEVYIGEEGEAEVETDSIGVAGDYTDSTGYDGRGNNAELTNDGNVALNADWNSTSSLANAAQQAAEFVQDEGDASELEEAAEEIQSQLEAAPEEPLEPQDVELEPSTLETVVQNVDRATEYRRQQGFPEEDVEEVRRIQTMVEAMLGEAQAEAQSNKMDKNRVYISSPSEAPDDALVREGGRGRYYYNPGDRGQNHDVGGDKENTLMETTRDDLEKQMREGEEFYDQVNETMVMIDEIEGDRVHVTTGSDGWEETADHVNSKLENGQWVHLPDQDQAVKQSDKEDPCWDGYEMVGMKEGENGEQVPNCVPKAEARAEDVGSTEKQEEEDPCWDGYEMVGTKVENGEEVPNCVPEDEVENSVRAMERVDKDTLIGKPFEGPEGQGPWDDYRACVNSMEDEDGISNAEGWCAWAHHEDTGDWPAEKLSKTTKVYVGSKEAVPEQYTPKQDDSGFYYVKEEAYEEARVLYPEVTEDQHEEMTDVEMTEPESAGDGVANEEEVDEEREERRSSIEEVSEDTGLNPRSL